MVGQSGLEPPTSRLSVVCSNQLSYWPVIPLGGDERNRTADPLLARQVLSQLSYTPVVRRNYVRFATVSSAGVFGAPGKAQRSGFDGERTSSGGNELSASAGSERSVACEDASVPSKLNNDTPLSHLALTIGRYRCYSHLKSP